MHYARWQRGSEIGGPESRRNPGLPCTVEGCGRRPCVGHGLCGMHYKRWRTRGTTDSPWPTLLERIMAKVDKQPDGCWIWTAATSHGYGIVSAEGRPRLAHRVLYELLRGEVSPDLDLDHLCMRPPCVNPDHLEPVTHAENMRRGPTNVAGRNFRKTHCPQGHPYSGDNILWKRNGDRSCRECNRQKSAAAYQRRKTLA